MSIPAGTLRERSYKTVTKRPREATPASLHSLQPLAPGAILQRAALAPESLRPAEVLRLQQTLGNRATGGLLTRPSGQRPVIQAKLTVNAPGDEYEREADRVAEQVMRMPAVQREELEEEEVPEVMTKREQAHAANGAIEAGEIFEQQLHASQGRGQRLPPNLRKEFEAKFGADFSGVRIHTDVRSAEMNQEIKARAFTHGQDIYLGPNQPDLQSAQARPLLAHELTHVLQQNGQRPIQNRIATLQPSVPMRLVQRLPTADDITTDVGAAEKGLFDSTKYKPVLKALNNFHGYVGATAASNETFGKLMDRYQEVQDTASNYLEKKGTRRSREDIEKLGDQKNKYKKLKKMLALADEVGVERVQAVLLLGRMDDKADLTWAEVLEGRSTGRSSKGLKKLHIYGRVFDEKAVKVKQRGGTNEVANVKIGQKDKGFWKADKSDVPLTPLIKAYQSVEGRDEEKMGAFLPGTRFATMGFQAIENEYNVPVTAGIIPAYELPEPDTATKMPKRPKAVPVGDKVAEAQMLAWKTENTKRQQEYKEKIQDQVKTVGLVEKQDLHLAKRDVAMYRLDQLLGVGIIAPTRLALMKSEGEYKVGSLMKAAEGTQAGKVEWNTGEVNREGGELQRLLSRLQLLDILAHQVDRNPGNFFLQFDKGGEVTHITGIDNDMAFGRLAGDIVRGGQEYPGVSEYVDKDLAEAIIKLDETVLKDAMVGLLSDEEIKALIVRLRQLRDHLKTLSDGDKLLSQDQWNKATAQGLIKEGRSYYAALYQKRLIKTQQ